MQNEKQLHLLVVFDIPNWADEFNIRGATVMLKSEFEARMQWAQTRFNKIALENASNDPMELEPIYVSFGSNDQIEYANFADYQRAFRTVELDAATAVAIKENMDKHGTYGGFGSILWIEPQQEEEDYGEGNV